METKNTVEIPEGMTMGMMFCYEEQEDGMATYTHYAFTSMDATISFYRVILEDLSKNEGLTVAFKMAVLADTVEDMVNDAMSEDSDDIKHEHIKVMEGIS